MSFLTKVVTVLAGALIVTGIGIPAQAASTDCPQTYYCVWANNNYAGEWFASAVNQNNYATAAAPIGTLENRGSSVYNNGTQSRIKAFVNSDGTGWHFFLNNPNRTEGKAVRDPNLSNGAGYGGNWTQNFDNKLSRHNWVNF